jgi:hypothetical protein
MSSAALEDLSHLNYPAALKETIGGRDMAHP